MMHCTIVGTSNSLMKVGYVPFLSRIAKFDSIKNLSIGGTPNILLPYMLCQNDFTGCDIVIIDTSVNDTWAIRSGKISRSQVSRYLEDAIKYLLDLGVVPVLLVMPTDVDPEDFEPVRAIVYSLAEKHDAILVDGYPILNAVRNALGCETKGLFLDEGHVVPAVSGMIAGRLNSAIRKRLSEPQVPKARAAARDFGYEYFSAASTSPQPVHRRSSLFERCYARIDEDHGFSVVFPAPREVIGFAMNIPACSAIVEILIDRTERKYFDFRFSGVAENQKLPFQHGLATNPIPFTATSLDIRVCSPSETPDQVIPLSHANNSRDNMGVAEIEGLILGTTGTATAEPQHSNDFDPQVCTLTDEELIIVQLISVQRDVQKLTNTGRNFLQVFNRQRNFGTDQKADLLRDIGRLLLDAGDPAEARRALTLALADRPNGAYIAGLLEQAKSAQT